MLWRLTRNSIIILVLLTAVGLIFWGAEVGVPVFLGGVLSLASLYSIAASVDRALQAADPSRQKQGKAHSAWKTGPLHLVRLLLILGVLSVMIHLSFRSMIGALLGLSIFVLAGFLEAILMVIGRRT